MTRNMNSTNNSLNPNSKKSTKEKRFSIHDAFEEETDDTIRVYGSTVVSHPTPKRNSKSTSSNDVTINFHEPAR